MGAAQGKTQRGATRDNASVNKSNAPKAKQPVDWKIAEGRKVRLHLASGEVVEASVLRSYKYTYLVLVAGRQVLVNKAYIVKVEL